MTSFFQRLALVQASLDTLLCIGLDPDPDRLPLACRDSEDPIFSFNRAVIDATVDQVCCYKPQLAHYSAIGAEQSLEKTITHIRERNVPVLLDGKRGDIGSTAERYAVELFERYGADAATVNPYLGLDAMQPFLDYADRGVFMLCRTSNPGGADVQELKLETGELLYEHIARQAAEAWNGHNNVGLVVGATQPRELARIREISGGMTFLVPGIGAQGGDIEATMTAGAGGGMILSSSRGILYAGEGSPDFETAVRTAAIATREAINRARK